MQCGWFLPEIQIQTLTNGRSAGWLGAVVPVGRWCWLLVPDDTGITPSLPVPSAHVLALVGTLRGNFWRGFSGGAQSVNDRGSPVSCTASSRRIGGVWFRVMLTML